MLNHSACQSEAQTPEHLLGTAISEMSESACILPPSCSSPQSTDFPCYPKVEGISRVSQNGAKQRSNSIDLHGKKFSVFVDSKNNLPTHAKQHETPKITLTFGKSRATLAAQGVHPPVACCKSPNMLFTFCLLS